MKYLVAVLLILNLTGCANPALMPPDWNYRSGDSVTLVGTVGALRNGPYRYALPFNDLIIRTDLRKGELRLRANVSSTSTLNDFVTPEGYYGVFCLNLRPGNYNIENVRFAYATAYSYGSWTAKEDFSMPFTLEANNTYYIGRLMAFGERSRNILGIKVASGGFWVIESNLEYDLEHIVKKCPGIDGSDIKHIEFEGDVPPFVILEKNLDPKIKEQSNLPPIPEEIEDDEFDF